MRVMSAFALCHLSRISSAEFLNRSMAQRTVFGNSIIIPHAIDWHTSQLNKYDTWLAHIPCRMSIVIMIRMKLLNIDRHYA